jgi:hypothetical protein
MKSACKLELSRRRTMTSGESDDKRLVSNMFEGKEFNMANKNETILLFLIVLEMLQSRRGIATFRATQSHWSAYSQDSNSIVTLLYPRFIHEVMPAPSIGKRHSIYQVKDHPSCRFHSITMHIGSASGLVLKLRSPNLGLPQ